LTIINKNDNVEKLIQNKQSSMDKAINTDNAPPDPEKFYADPRLEDGTRVIAFHATNSTQSILMDGLRAMVETRRNKAQQEWDDATDEVSGFMPFNLRQSIALQMDGGDLFGIDDNNVGRYRLDSKEMLAVKIDPQATWVVPGHTLETLRHDIIRGRRMQHGHLSLGNDAENNAYLDDLEVVCNKNLETVIHQCMKLSAFLELYQLKRNDPKDDPFFLSEWVLNDPSLENDEEGRPLHYQFPEMYLPVDKDKSVPPDEIIPFASNYAVRSH
jgi:hypothetical protein